MSFDLSGQTALVTGAAQGIGEGIADRLAKAGAEVVVADLAIGRAGEVAERLGGEGAKAYPVELDVCERDSVEAAVREVISKLGSFDRKLISTRTRERYSIEQVARLLRPVYERAIEPGGGR